MGKTKTLIISIIIFLIIGAVALYLILNKGYVMGKSLVEYEIMHEMSVTCDKEYLSVTDDEEAEIKVYLDGQEITENYTLTLDEKAEEHEVVEIDENTIIAKNVGTATITAKIEEYDLFSTVEVVVYKPIKKLTLKALNSTIRVGNDRQLTLTTTPKDATRTYIKYTSSNEEVATVNNNGIVTGISKGTVIITATDERTGISSEVKQIIK